MIIHLPLSVMVKNKKFILNLNNYRNTHHRVLSDAKKNYKSMIWNSIPDEVIETPVMLSYTYYHKSRGKIDIANPCSIIDKFACDVLVEKGVLPDDNIDIVKKINYIWGGVDKDNPRCELCIEKIF